MNVCVCILVVVIRHAKRTFCAQQCIIMCVLYDCTIVFDIIS